MRKYKYILFDLDGTLIYSHPGIYSCIRYALNAMGRTEEPSIFTLKKCIGPMLMESFTGIFGMTEKEAEEATRKYREQYSKTGVWENEPIEGSMAACKRLCELGYTLALTTSKPKVYSDQITARHGFDRYLSVQVGSGLDGSLPTKASVIAEAMRQRGAEKSECLMIGDRRQDAVGAAENGVDCALLRVGYGDEEELQNVKSTYIFNDFAALLEFLERI